MSSPLCKATLRCSLYGIPHVAPQVSVVEEHNETNAVMDLVLFEDAMKHVCRCVRVILGEGGHALRRLPPCW